MAKGGANYLRPAFLEIYSTLACDQPHSAQRCSRCATQVSYAAVGLNAKRDDRPCFWRQYEQRLTILRHSCINRVTECRPCDSIRIERCQPAVAVYSETRNGSAAGIGDIRVFSMPR